MPAIIKLDYNNDIRRIVLSEQQNNRTYPALVAAVSGAFGIPANQVRISWKDEDGDLVTIASQGDLEAALQFASDEALSALRIIVTRVEQPITPSTPASIPSPAPVTPQVILPQPNPPANPRPAQPPAPQVPKPVPQEFAPQVEASAAPPVYPQVEQESRFDEQPRRRHHHNHHRARAARPQPFPPQAVRHSATCDGCQETIYGNRYKCTVCYDFDLCERCEAMPGGTYHPIEHPVIKLRVPTPYPVHMFPFFHRMGMFGSPDWRGACPRGPGHCRGNRGGYGARTEASPQPTAAAPAAPQQAPPAQDTFSAPPSYEPFNLRAQTPQDSQPAQPEQPFVRYSTELSTLSDMGFNDLNLNTQLLDAQNGDLTAVINVLASLSM